MSGRRKPDEILATGAAWVTETELERLVEMSNEGTALELAYTIARNERDKFAEENAALVAERDRLRKVMGQAWDALADGEAEAAANLIEAARAGEAG